MFPIEAFYDSENVISISGYVLCLLFTLFAAHQINRLLTKKAKPCKEVVPKDENSARYEDIRSPVRMLRFSQIEVAKFLEICYLQLKDHPEQAGQVRATANEARMQHGMSSGLMKHFMVTAEFVADELMPMMKQVIKNRDSEIIKDILETILKKAEDMKTEAEQARYRYEQLRDKLQGHISDVNIRNHKIQEEQRELSIEKQEFERLVREAEPAIRAMEIERRQKLEVIAKMRKRRDELFASAVPSDADDQIWMELMTFSLPLLGGQINTVEAGIEIVKFSSHLIRQGMRTYSALKGGQQAQEAIDKDEERQNILREQIRERTETTQKRLAQIKRIDLRKSNLGDVKSLMEALGQLSKVDEMFTEIILFWENMTVFLKSLHNKSGAGKSFIEAIKTKKYAKMFEATITAAEKEWRKFGSICRAYASQTDQEIRMVYRFLSTPVDLMDIPQREARIKILAQEIERAALELQQ